MASKNVRPFTPLWRWIFGLGSVGAFLGGWAVLAHAPNPYANTAGARAPVVETAAPSSDTNQGQNVSGNSQPSSPIVPLATVVPQVVPTTAPVQQAPSTQRTTRQPRVRTGGS